MPTEHAHRYAPTLGSRGAPPATAEPRNITRVTVNARKSAFLGLGHFRSQVSDGWHSAAGRVLRAQP